MGWWKNPYHTSIVYIGRGCQPWDGWAQTYRDNRGGLGDGECI